MNNCKSIERLIIKYGNIARRKRTIFSLKRNKGLTKVARKHSNIMASKGRIFHGNGAKLARSALSIDSIWTLFYKFIFINSITGENCSMCPIGIVKGHGKVKSDKDLARVMVKGWLRSHGHRENLLNPSFKYIGVGVSRRGRKFYATQLFYG